MCIMSVLRNSFTVVGLCCAFYFVRGRCENAEDANTGWIPSVTFVNGNNSESKFWTVGHDEDDAEHGGRISPRALLNDFVNNDAINNFAVDNRNQLKATPYYRPSATNGNNYVYSSINTRPSATLSDAAQTTLSNSGSLNPSQPSIPYQTLQAPVISAGYAQGQGQGYHYPVPPVHQYLPPPPPTPAPQYLPPVSVPSNQYLPPFTNTVEILEPYLVGNQTGDELEINSQNLLYVQPGKCSNSIEVARIRDVEVKTAGYKYLADVQKGICVLMLYAHDEANKLAVSLQAAQGSVDLIPTGSWLQTNVKMYALQSGEIQPVMTTANFGPGSPALILTKSNIVILSFLIDRAVDFFVDISTYQSQYC